MNLLNNEKLNTPFILKNLRVSTLVNSDLIMNRIDKSKRKLQAAQKLLSDGFYEDAISLAYYAMFSAIRALLLTKNISPLSHKGLFIKFSERFIKTEIFPFGFTRIPAYAKEIRESGYYIILP